MGAIKKPNSMRTIRNIGSVAGLLFGFLDLYIVFTVDLNIVFTDLFAPLSMLYVPEALIGRVEVVGGIWMLLVTWAALRAGGLPRTLAYLGLVLGVAGILQTAVPALEVLEVLGAIFGLGLIVWFVWVGSIMLRGSPSTAAYNPKERKLI